MKKIALLTSNQWVLTLLLLLAGGLSFTSCDLLDEEDDEPKEAKFSDYFEMNFTRCERVGSVLQIDWTLRNKSKKDLQDVNIELLNAKDDLGNTYSGVWANWIAIGDGSFKNLETTISILKDETIKGTISVHDFDVTNSAKRVSLSIKYASATLDFRKDVLFRNLDITDNRILSNGIQTNDLRLTYTSVETRRSEDNIAYMCFTVTNNTGKVIKNFTLSSTNAQDNLGNVYQGIWTNRIAIENGEFNDTRSCDIAVGETKKFWVAIKGFSESANSINAQINCKSDNIDFLDKTLRFFNIRID